MDLLAIPAIPPIPYSLDLPNQTSPGPASPTPLIAPASPLHPKLLDCIPGLASGTDDCVHKWGSTITQFRSKHRSDPTNVCTYPNFQKSNRINTT